jgi:hypothetical protein
MWPPMAPKLLLCANGDFGRSPIYGQLSDAHEYLRILLRLISAAPVCPCWSDRSAAGSAEPAAVLLRGLAGLGWIRGLVWLGGSNIDAGHGIIFRISIWKDFPASLGDVLENRYYKQDN